MKIDVRLGCSICGFLNERTVVLPFDCDNVICPRCGESNCLSIVSIPESAALPVKQTRQTALRELVRIRELT